MGIGDGRGCEIIITDGGKCPECERPYDDGSKDDGQEITYKSD